MNYVPEVDVKLNSSSLEQQSNSLNNSQHASFYEQTRDSFVGKGYTRDITRHSTKQLCVDDFKILRVIGRGSFGKVYLV